MKHSLLFTLTILALMSCNNTTSVETEAEKKAKRDSFTMEKYGKTSDKYIEDKVNSGIADAMMDTVGLYKSPVKVTRARMVKKEYSNYRDIQLTYKNVSKKRIEGIKFMWRGTNTFGDPADMGNALVEGMGGGFSDDPLGAGKSETSTWNILSRDGKKVVLAWPTEVVFSDGTKWTLKN